MKNSNCDRCPCCSRHCSCDHLRCKRGCAYFAKLEGNANRPEKSRKPERGGLMHRLVKLGKKLKKRSKQGYLAEESFLAALSPEQQTALADLLEQLEPLAKKKEKPCFKAGKTV